MAFFVVERAADSTLSIPLPDAFPTREGAIAALSAATSSGALRLSGEIFIADLGTAVPVLVMAAAAPLADAVGAVTPEPLEVDLEEALVGPLGDETEAAEVEVALEELYIAPAAEEDEDSLAEAIKRATMSLEDEGIIAPASIEPEPAAMPTGVAEPASVRMAAEAEAPEEPAAEEPAAEEPEEEPDEAPAEAGEPQESWPWANIESYEAGETEDDEAADDPAVTEDQESEEIPEQPPFAVEADVKVELYDLTSDLDPATRIITSAPAEGEDAYLPRPVILGDYGADASTEEIPAAPIAELEPEADDIEISEPRSVADIAASLEEPIDTVEGDAESVDLFEPTAVEIVEASVEEGYAATGELNLAEYSCQDCIYSNTCPKVGDATPADCGSFQWRSE